MKTRIIVAVVLLPLLILVLTVLPPICLAILLAAMSCIAAYELLWGTGLVKHIRLISYSAVMAVLVAVWCYFGSPYVWGLAVGMVFFCLLLAEILFSKAKLPFEKALVCLAGGVLVPYLLSSVVRIRGMELGAFYVFLPFVLAFCPDTGAYFAGIFFGKHKLAPTISPKKTVEGFIGGVLASVLGVMIYSVILDWGFDCQVNYLYAGIYGVLGALASVFGDLAFSAIKRQVGIKDYGNLLPGHGGILDRFDSMTVVGPVTEVLLLILPIAEKVYG